MAHNKEELIEQSLKAIEDNKLFFISDLIAFLPCSRATFYNLELDKIDIIKEAIENNKILIKVSMRKKWFTSDNPVLQMGLMKLICTKEEFDKLTQNKTDITTQGKSLNITISRATNGTESE
jgi:hypothetical protein